MGFIVHMLFDYSQIPDRAYDQTVYLASTFLFTAAFFQILESARISLFGALRALRHPLYTANIKLLAFGLFHCRLVIY